MPAGGAEEKERSWAQNNVTARSQLEGALRTRQDRRNPANPGLPRALQWTQSGQTARGAPRALEQEDRLSNCAQHSEALPGSWGLPIQGPHCW